MTGGFGWRARIGQLYPAGGLADSEPQTMAPDGVLFVRVNSGSELDFPHASSGSSPGSIATRRNSIAFTCGFPSLG